MSAPGKLLHRGRGDLLIGAFPFKDQLASAPDVAQHHSVATEAAVRKVSAWLEASGVPCPVSDNVLGELWGKLILNCAVNAISALTQAPYGRMVARTEIKNMISVLVRETLTVGRAHGVKLKDIDHEQAVFRVIEGMSGQYSSTAQDIARGKPTEIDALNGYVATLAQQHGVDAPLNSWLTAMVKLREQLAR